ncbi:hypothetical protein ACFOGJ_18885 [Marinibaculum pumilum]|uniref:CN hydrolase domain-containing protein n=1 Tax=Marinibaculum pumilum TaxID=1766165 RepID=A0ABV7L4L4_9PROT
MACAELSVTGAPLGDLPLHGSFLDAVAKAVADLAAETSDGGPAILVGAPWRDGDRVHDAVLLLDGGKVAEMRFAQHPSPPFDAGAPAGPIAVRGVPLGVLIGAELDDADAAETLRETGAEILLAPCASPWLAGMPDLRLNLAVARVTETGLPLAWLNLLGGQEEALFDGGAFVLNGDCSLAVQAEAFAPGLFAARFRRGPGGWACATGSLAPPPEGEAALYRVLLLALADRLAKGGCSAVALCGGEQPGAALLAALAADLLGPDGLRDGPGPGVLGLATCDKTGLALGHAGTDGDFAPLRDLWAGELRRLGRWRNRQSSAGTTEPAVPEAALTEPGSDPDPVLAALLDNGRAAYGQDAEAYETALLAAEGCRRRVPPGPRLSRTAFGRDRRYPVVAELPGRPAG